MWSSFMNFLGSACQSLSDEVERQNRYRPPRSSAPGFSAIPDHYKTLAEVQRALCTAGLETSQLIVGIDFTQSNVWNGQKSFGGRSLHDLIDGQLNPYQRALDIIARTLEPFDSDHLIPVYGFGDKTTTDRAVFPFKEDESPCFGLTEVQARYNEIVRGISLLGPTSFAPLIRKTIDIVRREKQYHILLILTDGQVDSADATRDAIVEASLYPISIIAVGIGDADFTLMREFDDELPKRRFDNFQFVEFSKIINNPRIENIDVAFAVAALQEIPEQWRFLKRVGGI